MIPCGFVAKRIAACPDGLAGPGVDEIWSVSDCISPQLPAAGDDFERRNSLGTFDHLSDAIAVREETDGLRVVAYRIGERAFSKDGGELRLATTELGRAEDPPRSFSALGFDVVSRSRPSSGFECSPLSCNGLAREVPVNRFCLLPGLEAAIELAGRCALEQPEPGDYFVVEVLTEIGRRRHPVADAPRRS